MAKAVIFRTNRETRIMGALQCEHDACFDAEGCYLYCNDRIPEELGDSKASRLLLLSAKLGNDKVDDEAWYKHRENFIDVEFDYNVDQSPSKS